MINKFKKLSFSPLLLTLFCILLYPPYLKILPISYTKVNILVVAAITLCFNRKTVYSYFKKEYKSIIFAGLIVIASVLVPVIHDTNDYSYIAKAANFFIQIIYYLFMVLCIGKKHGNDNVFKYFLLYFALVHALHVIGTMVLVLLPSFKTLWFAIFSQIPNMEERLESYGYTFRFGWQGYAGFRLTMRCAISLSFVMALFINKKRFISTKLFVFIFIINLIGCMFYGRSGLIAGILISAPYFVMKAIARPKYLIAFAASLLVITVSLNAVKSIPIFHDWYIWMSTPIANYVTEGDMKSSSYDELKQMNSIEISSKTLFVGDGRFMDGHHYYRRTDAGFIRSILFWGLIIAIPVYVFTIIKLKIALKPNLLFFIQILIIFLIFEYKGDVYYEFLPLASILGFSNNAKKEQK